MYPSSPELSSDSSAIMVGSAVSEVGAGNLTGGRLDAFSCDCFCFFCDSCAFFFVAAGSESPRVGSTPSDSALWMCVFVLQCCINAFVLEKCFL